MSSVYETSNPAGWSYRTRGRLCHGNTRTLAQEKLNATAGLLMSRSRSMCARLSLVRVLVFSATRMSPLGDPVPGANVIVDSQYTPAHVICDAAERRDDETDDTRTMRKVPCIDTRDEMATSCSLAVRIVMFPYYRLCGGWAVLVSDLRVTREQRVDL
jgi:hypothetical protein